MQILSLSLHKYQAIRWNFSLDLRGCNPSTHCRSSEIATTITNDTGGRRVHIFVTRHSPVQNGAIVIQSLFYKHRHPAQIQTLKILFSHYLGGFTIFPSPSGLNSSPHALQYQLEAYILSLLLGHRMLGKCQMLIDDNFRNGASFSYVVAIVINMILLFSHWCQFSTWKVFC